MRDAARVSDDDRRAFVGFGFLKSLDYVGVVGAHSDLRDVDVAVADSFHGEVFAAASLAAGSEFRDCATWSGLRCLAAGVRIHLGIEDKDVDVLPRAEDVIESAEANVKGPTVATENPDALTDERVGNSEQVARVGGIDSGELHFEFGDPNTLRLDLSFRLVRRGDQGRGKLRSKSRRKTCDQDLGEGFLLIEGGPHAKAELGVVFEERVGPGRATAGGVLAVGGRGQIAAVDGGAAGRVGNVEPVAEQLREELDVGRFAAAGAGSGKLEKRLQKLQILHLAVRKPIAIDFGQGEEEIPILSFRRAQRLLRSHVNGLVARIALALHWADLDADRTSGAIFRSNLEGIAVLLHALPLRLRPLEGRRGLVAEFGAIDLGADDGVRADHDALAALDAEVFIPHGN